MFQLCDITFKIQVQGVEYEYHSNSPQACSSTALSQLSWQVHVVGGLNNIHMQHLGVGKYVYANLHQCLTV